MTTTVLFQFSTPDGQPIADTEFVVTLRKAAFHNSEQGLIYPEDVVGVTDTMGQASLELKPANKPYYLSMDLNGHEYADACQGGAFRWRFYVPVSEHPVSVRDLIVTDPTWSQTWDEEALQIIIDAKANAQASADRAKASEIAAAASAVQASDEATKAANQATDAAASAAAALASKNAAAVSQNAANNSAISAKGDADRAAASATAAAGSQTAAATEAVAANNSATAAKTSETNAKNSETNAAGSASAAATSATNAGSSAAAAATSATNANTAKTGAEAARDLAEKWASNPEDQVVQNGKYSAMHWAKKAETYAGSVVGVISDQGAWDASGGVYPSKPSNSTFWKVTVAGVVGGIDYGVGDTLMFSLALDDFYKIDNTEAVTSVNGMTGAVTVTKSHVGLGNVDNTSDANKPVSTAQQIALNGKLSLSGGEMTGELKFAPIVEVASVNGVVDLSTANSNLFHISGSGSITGIGPGRTGQRRTVRFTGAATLVSGASFQLARYANHTTQAGDIAEFTCINTNVWVCTAYFPIDGQPYEPVAVSHGGTGGTTQAEARSGLGLGTSAVLDTTTSTQDATIGRVMRIGDGGFTGRVISVSGTPDLNTYTTPGRYGFGNGVTNGPAAGVAYYMDVMSHTPLVRQTLWGMTTTGDVPNTRYSRASADGVNWTPWVRQMNHGDFGVGGSAIALTATTLASLTATQYVTTSAATTDVPTGAGTAEGQGYCEHIQHVNASYATQTWSQLNTGVKYTRTKSAGVWTAWTRLLATGDVSGYGGYMGTNTVSSTALNTITQSGNYYVETTAGIGQLPVASNGYLEVIGNSATFCIQRYTVVDLGGAWVRRLFNGMWGAWVRDYNTTNAVGPVAGDPNNSALFETGGTPTSRYIRHIDGTQECWGTATVAVGANTIQDASITFALPFIDTGYVPTALVSPATSWDHGGVIGYNGMTTSSILFVAKNGATAQNFTLKWRAIGRWKA